MKTLFVLLLLATVSFAGTGKDSTKTKHKTFAEQKPDGRNVFAIVTSLKIKGSGGVYHWYVDCRYLIHSPKIYVILEEDAIKANYRLCKACK